MRYPHHYEVHTVTTSGLITDTAVFGPPGGAISRDFAAASWRDWRADARDHADTLGQRAQTATVWRYDTRPDAGMPGGEMPGLLEPY